MYCMFTKAGDPCVASKAPIFSTLELFDCGAVPEVFGSVK